MRRSAYRRAAAAPTGRNRRLFAIGAVVTALGAAVAFTTISSAAENDAPAGSGAGKVVNGQVILTDTCVDSKLEAHDGFQKGDRCVSTEFGEVGTAKNNPSLLITQAPRQVTVNTAFTLKVSTRNLIRDRFLAAGKGGYYVESSVLQNGLVRGHFHTACRMLTSTNEAPAPEPVPAFFVATEDGKGNATPDEVTIAVSGLPQTGIAQCASWAGDGSHRIPMMERANQTPALDAVRITVRGANQGGGNNGGNQGGNNGNQGGNNGGNQGGGNTGGNNGGNTGGGQQPGNNNGGGGNGGNTGGGNTGGGGNGNAGGGNNNGGNTGGGNTGGNNGGNNDGGNNGATTAPTKPAGTANPTVPDTKDDFTPDPTKPAATKPATTGGGATGGGATNSGTTNGGTGNEKPVTTKPPKPATTKAATTNGDTESTEAETVKPAATSKAAAAGNYTYDDGQFNSGNKAPVADQVAEVQAASNKDDGGLLAKTGSNTIAAVGGAAVLLLVGLIIMALTRRRRPGTTWE